MKGIALSGSSTWLCTLLIRSSGQTWSCIPSHGLWTVVWPDGQGLRINTTRKLGSQGLERNMIRKLVTEKFENKVCGQIYLNVQKKNVKIFVFMWTKGWPQSIKSIKWRRWLICGYQSASFPTTSVIFQWTHEQSGHGGRDGGYAWILQYELPSTHQSQPGCSYCWVTNLQQRLTLSPWYGTWGNDGSYLMAG